MAKYPELTELEFNTLKWFAMHNGRSWKRKLHAIWISGDYRYQTLDDTAVLQGFRNTFGTSGLAYVSRNWARYDRQFNGAPPHPGQAQTQAQTKA